MIWKYITLVTVCLHWYSPAFAINPQNARPFVSNVQDNVSRSTESLVHHVPETTVAANPTSTNVTQVLPTTSKNNTLGSTRIANAEATTYGVITTTSQSQPTATTQRRPTTNGIHGTHSVVEAPASSNTSVPKVINGTHHWCDNGVTDNNESDEDDCPVAFSEIDDLAGENITDNVRVSWPCELRVYWASLSAFRLVDKVLLSYGTAVIVLMGLVCNIMALRTLMSRKMRQTSSHMYLCALAVFDTGNLLFNFLVGVLRGQNQDINSVFQGSEALCMIHSVFVELFNLLGPWIIVCFTIERFICVHYPLKTSTLCTKKRSRNTIIGITVAIFVLSCHKLLVSGFEGDSVFGYKACKTNRIKSGEIIYFYVAFSTWLPSFAIMLLNAAILIKIKVSGNERRNMSSQNQKEHQKSKQQEGKLTKMLLVVSSAYLILVIPLGLLQSAEITWKGLRAVDPGFFEPQRSEYIEFMSVKFLLKCIRTLCFFFYQLNFAINFFLYLLSGEKFREVLKQQYRCVGRERHDVVTSRNTGSEVITAASSVDSVSKTTFAETVSKSEDGRY